MPPTAPDLVLRGGRVVLDPAEAHDPPRRDLTLSAGRISAVEDPAGPRPVAEAAEAGGARVIDCAERLVVPGFVNAHYHSYDVLAKGLFEDLPFDLWALLSQPAYWGRRSAAELRLRTLVGAIDCLRHGVTCVQDMNSLVPQDEDTLDAILSAYAELGIRVVFSCAVRDVAALDIAPFLDAGAPAEVAAIVAGAPGDADLDLDFVAAQLARRPAGGTLHWALSPSGPQRCSTRLLEGIGALSAAHGLPVTTHVYETRAQLAKARAAYPEHGGSLIRLMQATGLLTPRTHIAHSVWITRREIDLLAEAGTGVIHNPAANLKLKNGVAPLRDLREAGVNIGLGCDNCSCSDTQNIFQAMKLFTLLAAGSDPMPGGPSAADALRAATEGGARAVGLGDQIGRIAPRMRADLVLLDLTDIAYQPLNSAVRQLVYAEAGRGVRSVIVEGRVVLDEGRLTGIDEAALRAELAEAMQAVRRDYAALHARQAPAFPWLLDATRRLADTDLGMSRFIRRPAPEESPP